MLCHTGIEICALTKDGTLGHMASWNQVHQTLYTEGSPLDHYIRVALLYMKQKNWWPIHQPDHLHIYIAYHHSPILLSYSHLPFSNHLQWHELRKLQVLITVSRGSSFTSSCLNTLGVSHLMSRLHLMGQFQEGAVVCCVWLSDVYIFCSYIVTVVWVHSPGALHLPSRHQVLWIIQSIAW